MDPIDTRNRYSVGARSNDGRLFVLRPPLDGMTPAEALVFAAWLVALADPGGERFPAVLEAVLNA